MEWKQIISTVAPWLGTALGDVVIGYLFNEASAVTSYYYGEFKQRTCAG